MDNSTKFNISLLSLTTKSMILERLEFLNSKAGKQVKDASESIGFSKEHMTFRIKLPRRFGSTTIAGNITKDIDNCSVILHQMKCQNDFISKTNNFNKDRIASIQNYDQRLRGIDTKILIVDVASYLLDDKIDSIYNFFGSGVVYLFIE